nr:metal ABC transporter permease [Actinomycetales bacterium]
ALGVTEGDIVSLVVFATVVLAGSLTLYRPLLVLSFSPQKANALGMRPRLAHALLLALIAIAIIGAFQTVGTMLAFGLLVGPPATAALLSRTIPQMFVWSAGISAVSVVAGLVLSYHLGTAASASMALVPVILFFIVLTVSNGLRLHRRRVGEPAVPGRVTAPAALDPLDPVS